MQFGEACFNINIGHLEGDEVLLHKVLKK